MVTENIENNVNSLVITTSDISTPIVKKTHGRPLGVKNKPKKLGLDLKKRLKVLQKIILNPNEKANDRLQAIKIMTELLSDGIKETIDGKQEIILSYENIKEPKEPEKLIKPIKKIEIKEEIVRKSDENINNCIKEIQNTSNTSNTNSEVFEFIIDPNSPNIE